MKKRVLIIALLLIAGLVCLYIFDPPFTRTVEFGDYSVEYRWRIFNNFHQTLKTFGHCPTNEIERYTGEVTLYKKLIENYHGQEEIKEYLVEVVKTKYGFATTYLELTGNSEIDIDTIIKYKDEIFHEWRIV